MPHAQQRLVATILMILCTACSSSDEGRGNDTGDLSPMGGAGGAAASGGSGGDGAAATGGGAAGTAGATSAGGSGGASATGGAGGSGGDAGNQGSGDAMRPATMPGTSTQVVKLDTTAGRWRTARDVGTGRFVFIAPDGQKAVLQGVSMTGFETGTRGTASGAGFWLFNAASGDQKTEAPRVIENVVGTLTDKWHADVVRIPICGSAWTQNYVVKDWGQVEIGGYQSWVDVAVKKARAAGKVVILDLHLWAIAKMSKGGDMDRGSFERAGQSYAYADWEDGCSGVNNVDGVDSCAPKDWYTDDPTRWECAIANADGVTLHNAYKNRDAIAAMWTDIANRYEGDSAVWFELFNEPYTRKSGQGFGNTGDNEEEPEYPWDLWAAVMQQWLVAIRDTAGASNIVIINGLDWGYSFGPDFGPIAEPDTYLPWLSQYANVAYGFHPYQHGSCCGAIGANSTDEGASDPYQSGYCAYYADGSDWGEPSGAPLPGGAQCIKNGYAASQDKKLPPCHWVATAFNPSTQAMGLCAGDRIACSALTETECTALDSSAFEAGGWSRYVLPMNAYGPLIATEFGSFDCSSPFVRTLLGYMTEQDISYTAWALWPQNSGGPGGLGACGYPSVMASSGSGDFRQCQDANGCQSLIAPLPWAGQAVFDDLLSH